MAAVWGHSDKVLALILAERAESTDESAQEVSVTLFITVYQQTHHSSLWQSPHWILQTGEWTFTGK